MVQAMINVSPEVNQILNIVKARFDLKTKSDAITKVVVGYGLEILEPELKPDYIKKLKNLETEGKFTSFNSINELRKSIENA